MLRSASHRVKVEQKYPLEGVDIYRINTETHEDLFSKFNEFLLDHGI